MSSTNNDHLEISELQAEALREILNMGAGRAAASLGALTGEHILLSVPSVRLTSVEDLHEYATDYDEGSQAVMLKVSGDLTGFTSIVFSLSYMYVCSAAPKKFLHRANRIAQTVDLFAGVVQVKACPGGGGVAKSLVQRLRAMMSRADCYAVPINHLRHIMRVDPVEYKGHDPGPLIRRGTQNCQPVDCA